MLPGVVEVEIGGDGGGGGGGGDESIIVPLAAGRSTHPLPSTGLSHRV